MRIRFLVPAIAALLVAAAPAQALTVDEIVAKHVDALGGGAKLAAIKSIRQSGKIVTGRGEERLEGEWADLVARPGILRSEFTQSIITEGCIINDAKITGSIIGIRSRIEHGATIEQTLMTGLRNSESGMIGSAAVDSA